MKNVAPPLLFLLLCSVAAADPEFKGIASAGDHMIFSISEGSTSEWVKLGDTFGAYTIESFDKDSQVLTVTDGSKHLRLPLALGKSLDSSDPNYALKQRIAQAEGLELARLLVKEGGSLLKTYEQRGQDNSQMVTLEDLLTRYDLQADRVRKMEQSQTYIQAQSAPKDDADAAKLVQDLERNRVMFKRVEARTVMIANAYRHDILHPDEAPQLHVGPATPIVEPAKAPAPATPHP